ncbi:hypothetical protein [Neisseria gonorrhoeae]|uniref:hypothetical protein n=1 Tax=Neisseria gonorrhoeae TaxID=485 RepID=UPI0019339A78|nr:hypothetical protein [Neisseria gonorrhoeae]
MQTVATKPTAKQMLAAKRAAKESTRQERAVKRASATPGQARERTKTHDVSRTQQP